MSEEIGGCIDGSATRVSSGTRFLEMSWRPGPLARWDWQGKCCEFQAQNVGASTIKKSCSNSFVVMKVFVPLKLVVLLFEGEKLGEA